MRNVFAIAALIMLPLTAAAQSGLLPQGVFPKQPVPMSEGYGADGAGNHFGVPTGVPGDDCLVNPVSFRNSSVEETTTKFVAGDIISIPTTILFDFDGDVVRPEGHTDLGDVYQLLTESGVLELKVVGHTDSKGTEEYNEKLGLRRAAAVALVLTALGFEDIEVGTGGELEPVAPNTFEDGSDNPEGRQANRRVEIEVTSVRDVEVEETVVVVQERNPQVFHVLSKDNKVACGVDPQDRRTLLWWDHGYYPSYNRRSIFGGRVW